MSTYKELIGKPVKYLSSDPTDAGAEGQIWYNSTSGTFKTVLNVGTWSSGGALGTAVSLNGGAGIQTAGLSIAGSDNGVYKSNVQEYNGSSWTAGTSYPSPIYGVGTAGTQTAALAWAGFQPAPTAVSNTNEYDGSTWTASGSYPTAGGGTSGFGIQTAAIGTTPASNTTVSYNGSTWTALGAPSDKTISTLDGIGALGISTAGLLFGGRTGSGPVNTSAIEEWDGSVWTNSANLPVANVFMQGSGTQTDSILFGGDAPPAETASSAAFTYNGTSVSTAPSLGTAVTRMGSAKNGTSTAALSFGGIGPGGGGAARTATEEYNVSIYSPIAATWASGGNLATARQDGGGFGLQDAGVVVGGETPALTNATEEYDGAAWTAGGTYPATYTRIGTAGTLTAGLAFGGGNPYGNTTTSEYDGSTWTAGGAFPLSYASMGGAGTQTAGLSVGGDAYPTSPRYSNLCFEYDGAAWTAGGSLGSGRYSTMAAGLQTAAATNGGSPVPSFGTATEEYDGSTWTTGGTGLIAQGYGGSSKSGTQDNFITFVANSPNYAFVQGYDGTNWSTRPSLNTGRYGGTGAGTASSALAIGGREPGFSVKTEEFTGEIPALDYKTLTSS